MQPTKPAVGSDFDLPESVREVLPSDPFEQLDVARKITSIALATRVSKLESESSRLKQKLAEKDDLIAELQAQVENLDSALSDTSDKLAQAHQQKESLMNENASLSEAVKKLNRDVAKLETFRKTLMQSLQEEDDISGGALRAVAKQIPTGNSFSSGSTVGEEDASQPSLAPPKPPPIPSQSSETGNSSSVDSGSVETDALKHGVSHGPLLASQSSTPRRTPPDSPPRYSTGVSPKRLSKPTSPRRHSISFSTPRSSMFEDRSSIFSSYPSSHHSSLSGSLDAGSQSGRSRVDGKEFFRQVRSRLSYEQFGAFLANVKELNSQKQTKEETLRKAEEIFGPDNKDLYIVFEGLISRTPADKQA